jgi:hypothetical protein
MLAFISVFQLWCAGMNEFGIDPLMPGTFVETKDPHDREVGIVVACWYEDQIKDYDCYVAFFGDTLPEGKPARSPYILRYAVTSLLPIEKQKP